MNIPEKLKAKMDRVKYRCLKLEIDDGETTKVITPTLTDIYSDMYESVQLYARQSLNDTELKTLARAMTAFAEDSKRIVADELARRNEARDSQ